MKTLKEMDLKGKKVLVRVDFNVPLKASEVADDEKIKAVLPTINYLSEQGAKIILASHLGRPEGKNQKFSLRPVAKKLRDLTEKKVVLIDNCLSPEIKSLLEQPNQVLLLENLRFYPGEEANDEGFAKRLASLAEVFVQEAFACCHRNHASIVGPPKYIPACAGFLLEKEIEFLSKLLTNPQKPFVVIVGGKKVETKAKVIDRLSEKVDLILIGGLMKKELKGKNITLKYPQKIIEPVDDVDEKDIGPKTINLFKDKILLAKTIFWNGPLGVFEDARFEAGTKNTAWAIAEVTLKGATSIIGGGETVAAAKKAGIIKYVTHVSTGGGATLEFLEGKTLPGIAVLD